MLPGIQGAPPGLLNSGGGGGGSGGGGGGSGGGGTPPSAPRGSGEPTNGRAMSPRTMRSRASSSSESSENSNDDSGKSGGLGGKGRSSSSSAQGDAQMQKMLSTYKREIDRLKTENREVRARGSVAERGYRAVMAENEREKF